MAIYIQFLNQNCCLTTSALCTKFRYDFETVCDDDSDVYLTWTLAIFIHRVRWFKKRIQILYVK